MPEQHWACRSLLQKAVRRGQVELVAKLSNHLAVEEEKWLRTRIGVIAFEDCWPLGGSVDWNSPRPNWQSLLKIAASTKDKEAAGIASFALAVNQGRRIPKFGKEDDRLIQDLAEKLEKPKEFFADAKAISRELSEQTLIESARRTFGAANWDFDKAFCVAAVYLTITRGIPTLEKAPGSLEMPLWVGLDKHTHEGKTALLEACRELSLPNNKVLRASFYLEGGLCNSGADGIWWKRDVDLRLAQVDTNLIEAMHIWEKARPVYLEKLKPALKIFEEHLAMLPEVTGPQRAEQMGLFNS